MEELTIWEQHTITLTKVSVGQERIGVFGLTSSVWSGSWRIRHGRPSHDSLACRSDTQMRRPRLG